MIQALLARATSRLEFAFPSRRLLAVESNLTWIARSGILPADRPAGIDRTARSIFESYHRLILEYLAQGALDRRALDSRFRFLGMETLYRALAPGRGAVVVAPHVGNWELAGIALARLGFLVHVVTGVQFHARFTRFARLLKERERILVSTPVEGFRPLLSTLRRGGIVVLLADGDVFVRSYDATFFGRLVPFPLGPALLARRAGAALVHAHAERTGSGAHVVSIDGIELPRPELPVKEDVRRLTRRVAEWQERTIAAHLDQWCIFRPLFQAGDAA
ncbi:MAG TPA: lysophospholipid acyltransferase family protein [Candidatus Limnocylindrales bacterium]|nr:lysophospholipid acyltransferase family protein [Candidatus Limnocylindrales bacterium]